MVAASNRSLRVLQARAQARGRLAHRQHEVELGALGLRGAARFTVTPVERERGAGRVLQHEHHLKQRIAAQVARRGPAPPPASRRAGPGACRPPAAVSRTRASSSRKRGFARQVRAQHQRVDEEPDQLSSSGGRARRSACPPRCRPGRCSEQQHLEGRQQRHEQRRPFAPAQRLERRSEPVRARAPCRSRPAVARIARARPVGGQLHGRQLRRAARCQYAQLRREHRALQPRALPDRVVGVLDRQRGQRGSVPRTQAP